LDQDPTDTIQPGLSQSPSTGQLSAFFQNSPLILLK
jgi:hypothetical protein